MNTIKNIKYLESEKDQEYENYQEFEKVVNVKDQEYIIKNQETRKRTLKTMREKQRKYFFLYILEKKIIFH